MLAHTSRLVCGKGRCTAGRIQPQAGGSGVGSQRVIDGVNACSGNGGIESAVFFINDLERCTVRSGLNIHGADISVLGVDTEPDGLQPGRHIGGGQQVVVSVEHQRRTIGQAGTNLHLCFQYILPSAEIFQVGDAYHRDDARRRPCATGQSLYLTRMVHAHFDDGVLGIVIQAEQRIGHADIVVLVALGFQRLAKGGQHGVTKLFRRGLSDTAGDADHLGAKQHTVVGRHSDHGFGAVRHNDGTVCRDALDRVVGDDIGCAVLVRTCSKVVAINAFAGKADKDAARLDLAAVRNDCMNADRLGQRQAGQQLIGRNLLHEKGPPWDSKLRRRGRTYAARP